MKSISTTVVGIIVSVVLGVLAGTAQAVMVSGWEPVGDNVVTLTFSDEAGNTVIGSIRKAIFWEMGTEQNPKFVQWDDTATFILRTKDGKEKPLPNAEVKKRIKTVYRNFAPAGKLSGDLTELMGTTPAKEQARPATAAAQPTANTVKGVVSGVSIRTGEAVIPNLNQPQVNVGAKGSTSSVVIELKDVKSTEYMIPVPEMVELQGFTDLKGKHQMMGGLLILSDLQKRLTGKNVEVKCSKGGEKEGTMIYSVSEVKVME
jgi:hypothetical protein